ncbi:MAG: uracil-DNA glycosylase [Phycisphaerales bacterium]|nr:uracil-DNA glycosylase [Phycisphaerales bacterium]
MPIESARLLRIARQAVLTDLSLGVDLVPIGCIRTPSSSRVAVSAPEPTPAAAPLPRVATLPRPAPSVGTGPKAEKLSMLHARHDAECLHCTGVTTHTQTVFGEGNPDAKLMFVGEAPGENEDKVGRPFVGRAGQKLDEMIAAMGLRREDVYIANVLKSRPPDNRTPLGEEVMGCGPWLSAQIEIIQPQVLVSLGGPATKYLLGLEQGITKLRGIWAQWQATGSETQMKPIRVMPTFHPAYLLRNYTVQTRQEVWSDLQQVMEALGLLAK